jgi:hypothetical protein
MSWKKELKSEIIYHGFDLGYFTLQELYNSSIQNLSIKYPKNNSIKASMQGTLQKLRDDGYLQFVYSGTYLVISKENDEWILFIDRYRGH